MIKFWKEHTALRVALIAAFFLGGLVLIFVGWKMPSANLAGLCVMLVGLALLLVALWLYNKPYQDPPKPREKK